ncbi:MAG: hypothetical protein C4574_04735 [Candidatus Latescibacterota bacterium]|nr:MAG: hypothetical protein C4574_04735 [Candidatus Latescibacterota bacterium]
MVRCMRHGSARILVACALVSIAAGAIAFAAFGQDKRECQLCFAPPDSAVFHYKIFSQDDQSFRGGSATLNQTAEIDLKMSGRDEDGNTITDIKFGKLTSSLVSNNQLMEWEPPVKLEGRTIRAFVSRKGKIVDVKALGNIPGIGGSRELLEIVEPWFVRLPDSSFAVGDTWTREILEGVKEGQEPDRAGRAVYTLKKLEKKGGIEVAVIEAKINAKLNRETPVGILVGTEKTDLKASVAIGSGHIVELKRVMEVKGDVIARDELTNKETKRETAIVSTYEAKLQK